MECQFRETKEKDSEVGFRFAPRSSLTYAPNPVILIRRRESRSPALSGEFQSGSGPS